MEIKWTINEYYEQLYAHIFDTLDEVDLLLLRCKLPKLTKGKIGMLNNPIRKTVNNYKLFLLWTFRVLFVSYLRSLCVI